jgi:hypothetical protein
MARHAARCECVPMCETGAPSRATGAALRRAAGARVTADDQAAPRMTMTRPMSCRPTCVGCSAAALPGPRPTATAAAGRPCHAGTAAIRATWETMAATGSMNCATRSAERSRCATQAAQISGAARAARLGARGILRAFGQLGRHGASGTGVRYIGWQTVARR